MTTRMEIQLDPTKHAPGTSRSHLHAIRDHLEPRFDDVALVVSELVTNSIKHSPSRPAPIDLSVAARDGSVRIEVHDRGPGFDPKLPRGSGLGLTLIERLAEDWGVATTEGCTVWVEMSLGDRVKV